MKRITSWALSITMLSFLLLGCPSETPPEAARPDEGGLLLALATFAETADGPKPEPATLGLLRPGYIAWTFDSLQDPESNVFHKAMVCDLSDGQGEKILTAGGTSASLKLWSSPTEFTTVWQTDFGGSFSRMRDVEVADVVGDPRPEIVVATHDQGVVAVVTQGDDGSFEVTELDREPGTIVHEIEVGDLNSDGILEIYATPSQPNKLDGTPQSGTVVRYVPGLDETRTVVAALGDRHAKEILAADVDGDGVEELYVAVEAVSGGSAQILRFDADTPADQGQPIATLPDTLCRCLTTGDLDGDGKREIVATLNKAGVWRFDPPSDGSSAWSQSQVDAESSGFEHASVIADLDGDGISELYVANDDDGEVNRYVWTNGDFVKETLYVYPDGLTGFTWNIMPLPKDFEF